MMGDLHKEIALLLDNTPDLPLDRAPFAILNKWVAISSKFPLR